MPSLSRQHGISPPLVLQSLDSPPLLQLGEIGKSSIQREDFLFPSIASLGRIGFTLRDESLNTALPLLSHAFGGFDRV